MKSIMFKTLNIIVFSLIVSCGFAQNKQEKQVIESKNLPKTKQTELKSVNVEKNNFETKKEVVVTQTISNRPDVEKNAPQKVSVGKENMSKKKTNQPQLSDEQKLNSLESRISSLESKIELLSDDPITNQQEIADKKLMLEKLKFELNSIKK